MKLWKLLGMACLSFFGVTAQAATLTGSTVGGKLIVETSNFEHLSSSATVGAGVEFTVNWGAGYTQTADVSESLIEFSASNPSGFLITSPYIWTITLEPQFVFASIVERTGSDTFPNNFVLTSFADNVAIFTQPTIAGINGPYQYRATYDFTIREVNAVPEPSTYALMLAGLGLLGFMAKRRKQ